ncbi:ABC transporter ATP-binding protein [Candidimonas nitroreducens]|uniref:ABC transporter ATP-binding protein n=1 Tax=Candidimonas nitroreducens TaxID=683354 RepID=A0A225M3R2_9BURK|nr:ABC transporter ATP-binding protein [Candidimonas nitroreducens]OWT54770.1 ABC transporter ATP-binding protein [Candidimonas nitroreducens]
MTDTVLRIDQAVGGYGDLTILHGVDMAVPAGSWITIIGANGAGKSTLLKLVAGIVRCRGGAVHFEGRDVTALDSLARLRLGIGLVPQGRCNFPLLSVAENLKLGAYTRRLRPADLEAELQQVTARFPRLKERWHTMAGNLSGGEQQIMEMAMVLLARPRLLLLDEPSLGLSPQAMGMVFDTIRELTASGLSVLMVEQNARQALECCDYGVVMELGRNKLFDRASAVLAHPEIRRLFLGL